MFLLLLVALSSLLFFYLKWTFSFWKRNNFPYVEAKIPFGIMSSVIRKDRSIGMAVYDVYLSTKEKVIGVYLSVRPALLIRDAQLVRDILAKDFGSFHDRGVYVDEKNDPMSAGIFSLEGNDWKNMRTKLTPSFTSGKLKGMFGTVEDVSNKMLGHLNTIIPDKGFIQLDMEAIFRSYAVDIIASVMFGLEIDSFKDPNNEFNILSGKIGEDSFTNNVRNTTGILYPKLEKLFVRFGWLMKTSETMRKLVHRTIDIREKSKIIRKDLLQLLLQLRNFGKINEKDEVWSSENKSGSVKSISIDSIAAQLFVFYAAGFITTAATAAYTLLELSLYPEVLAKLQKDIEETIEKHGKLTYDAIHDMKYLDLCIKETLRKYPGLPILNRQCTEDYPIPGTNQIIKKGTPILISLFGMQRDPDHFPNPSLYDPERYLEENMRCNPIAYMPFGEGPRHCIAKRMGIINVKVALVKVLTNFDIEIKNTRRDVEIANYGLGIVPKDGFKLNLAKKKKKIIS